MTTENRQRTRALVRGAPRAAETKGEFVPHEGLFVGNVHPDVVAGIFDLAEIVVKMERDPLSLAILALPGIAALASYAKPRVRTREAPPTRNMPVIADLLKKPT